eukprot:scaffold8111_cov110-Isochrysis_galbana.AAC.2
MRKQAALQRRRTQESTGPTHRHSLPRSSPVVGRVRIGSFQHLHGAAGARGARSQSRNARAGTPRERKKIGGLGSRDGLTGGAHVAHSRQPHGGPTRS